MPYEPTLYCTQCGRPGRGERCDSCGATRVMSPREHAGHVGFLLNELELPPLSTVGTLAQRAGLRRHYETELWRALMPDTPRPAMAVAAPSAARITATPPVAASPPPRPPVKREPINWDWLAEQQANLLLFAGAFLTVVAALIYVAYSGQAVGGALKMTLLALYTVAFLVAGVTCLRVPRVVMAGHVFFGIGALLVPINFVAAREIFTESDLSAESMWLAASIVTAGFYTAVAWLGMGRLYAIGAGLALVSGTGAATAVSGIPIEWAALPFIFTAFVMVMTDVDGDERQRERIGSTWTWIGQATGTAAAAFVVFFASVASAPEDSLAPANGWFLPVTLAAYALAALVPMLLTRQPQFGIATAVAAAAAGVSTAYALDQPAEGWTLTAAAVAAVIGATLPWGRGFASRLPERAEEALTALGLAALALAGAIAFFTLQLHAEGTRELTTRWFLAPSAACAFVFAAFVASGPRGRGEWGILTSIGMVTGAAGVLAGILFAYEAPAEAYALAIAAAAVALTVFGAAVRGARGQKLLPATMHEVAIYAGVITCALAAAITGSLMWESTDVATRWFAPATFALTTVAMCTYALSRKERGGAIAVLLSLTGLSFSIVYALELSGEYYAFALIAPALVAMAAVRFATTHIDALIGGAWHDDVVALTRMGAALGALVAIGAAIISSDDGTLWSYEPQTRFFLPAAMLLTAVMAGIDASRGRRFETSAALALASVATALSMAYALEASAEWYGAALIGSGIALALTGLLPKIAWFDDDARDGVALVAVVLATLPFESAYAQRPEFGAAVHFAAASFFAGAAVLRPSAQTFGEATGIKELGSAPLSGGWLYPAGLSAATGYIFLLRAMGGDGSGEGTLALPLLTISLAFAGVGAGLRFVRPDLRLHLYVLSLVAAIASLGASSDADTLAALLTVYVALFAALGAFERSPLPAVCALAFTFLAVPAWQQSLDAPLTLIPAAYAALGLLMYGTAIAIGDSALGRSLRAAGAAFSIVAPAAGFGILYAQDDPEFQATALYQWSTIAVALAGMLGLVESIVAGRRWMIVPASAVMTVALLLQIGRIEPQNIQAYTSVIGAYLVLLGLVGLGRLRLIPEWAPAASYVEALGAATIMLPSFVQSFGDDWRYQWILVVEATLFLVAAVALRRRGLLAAALLFLTLVAGRVLFDAVNALPNWIVVALCGIGLLGAGMAILLGRERWEAWQRTVIGWWQEADTAFLSPQDETRQGGLS